ncbi:MAG: ATP phosphoribosyltransferase [Acidobacteriota bacterium]
MSDTLRIGLPKGRMEAGVQQLLSAAGIRVAPSARNYRPQISLPLAEAKIQKPQNVIEMLAIGRRDAGFAGADWVAELGAELVEVLDTELDPVQLVAAAPESVMSEGRLPRRALVVASEYENLTRRWMRAHELDSSRFVRSYGATEVFPPEDADVIVDNSATGATLRANGLVVVDRLLESSTRLYAAPQAWEQPSKRRRIEDLAVLLRSVMEARRRVMIEVNAPTDCLDSVVAVLPAMRQPTVSPLSGEGGFAIKAAVPRDQLPTLILALKAAGGSDIVVAPLSQIVP